MTMYNGEKVNQYRSHDDDNNMSRGRPAAEGTDSRGLSG